MNEAEFEITRTLDNIHTLLSYVRGSLKNVTIVTGEKKGEGFIFTLLNPPVPLGGNIVSIDVYVDDLPVKRNSIFIATSEEVVNAAALSEKRPLAFKPYQSARFLVINEDSSARLDGKKKHKIVVMSRLEGFEDIMVPFTFTDKAAESKDRIFVPLDQTYPESAASIGDTIFKNFTTPLVLSGKKAYIVCSSNGAISANWTWMGVRYDNGGLYVPPARAFGRIIVEISVDEGVRKRLPNFVTSSTHESGVLQTLHDLAGMKVKRTLTVPFENSGFMMVLELELPGALAIKDSKKSLKKSRKRNARIHFLIDGNITSYGLAAISQSNHSKFNTEHNCLQISTGASTEKDKVRYFGTIGIAPSSMTPVKVLTDSFDNDLELSYDVEVQEGKTVEIALIGTGSYSDSNSCLKEFTFMRDNYRELLRRNEQTFKQFSSSTLNIRSSAQERKQNSTISRIIHAYDRARTAMQYLKAEYSGMGEGICAGLPRFPNYWARDTGWSLRGYLSIGDYRFAHAIIDNFLKHQAKTTTKGAVVGELPMIISGKSFLHTTTFGSADSTFLFPWAIKEYVLGSGDTKYLKKMWKSVVSLVDWGFYKDIDGDGLLEHGFTGTASKLPIQDSTWMDHIDRRKSANDIQALFYESLKIGSDLAAIAGDDNNQKKWSDKALEIRELIDKEYWNNRLGFYYDTIRRDGTKDQSIRPNALVLLMTGAVKDREKAESVLSRIEKDDITTDWGLRTLSSADPKYNPTLYHDGAVWPLVTSWAALSELKFGRRESALKYTSSMADRIIAENGMFAETYRGDRPEPFNSCILQAWSVGLYVHTVREMLLGMRLNMIENKIQFEPLIPESLESATIPINFEHNIVGSAGDTRRLDAMVDPHHRKISIRLKDWNNGRPEITSSTYDIAVTPW